MASFTPFNNANLASIAADLGVAYPDKLYIEHLKIDRQNLLRMIDAEGFSGVLSGAEEFFNIVMMETTTHINWPNKLKVDARHRKDPRIWIVGQFANVLQAKNRIMERLDRWRNRVIMKMEVSYTDHKAIIGPNGSSLQRIQAETGANIHFPDSNLSNSSEKSNTVSLHGSPEAIQRARVLVRESAPIVITFLARLTPGLMPPNSETSYVKMIRELFNVEVKLFPRPNLYLRVLIKGPTKEEMKVKEATRQLMHFMCDNMTSTRVQMQMEISPQNHRFVLGKDSINLQDIMNRTGTKIVFPNANDVDIWPIERSRVTITGSIDGVYQAKQQLIDNLPVTLMFEYPDNAINYDIINNLVRVHDVTISALSPKSRQTEPNILIRGTEKFISNIYNAYNQLFRWYDPEMNVDKLQSYSFSIE